MSRNVQHPKHLYAPFQALQPLEVSQYYEPVRRETDTWAETSRLITSERAVKRFVHADFSLLGATTFPRSAKRELLQISQFLVFLFMLDDQVDDAALGHDFGKVYGVLYDILSVMKKGKVSANTNKEGWSAYKLAYSDWWQEVSRYQSEEWRQRFRIAHADYFESYLDETKNRSAMRVPSIEEYTILRRETGAVKQCFCLVELELGLQELTPEVFDNQTVKTLCDYSNDIICWTNDIFSVDKEFAKGEVNNMVIVVYHEKHCSSLQQAANIVSRMILDRCEDFMRIRREHMPNIKDIHPTFSDAKCKRMQAELEQYIEGCALWVAGNYRWSIGTQRYSQQGVDEARANSAYVEDILQLGEPIVAPPVTGHVQCSRIENKIENHVPSRPVAPQA